MSDNTVTNKQARLSEKEYIKYMLDNTNSSTSLHQILYNEIYEYFVINNEPTKLDLEMIEYLSPKKIIDNNAIRDIIKYFLIYTYRANAQKVRNHKKINDSLDKIQEQLNRLLKLHDKIEPSATPITS
jgi:hypothetical protein